MVGFFIAVLIFSVIAAILIFKDTEKFSDNNETIRPPIKELVDYYNDPDNQDKFKLRRVYIKGLSKYNRSTFKWYTHSSERVHGDYICKSFKLIDALKGIEVSFHITYYSYVDFSSGEIIEKPPTYDCKIIGYKFTLTEDEKEYLCKNIAERFDEAIIFSQRLRIEKEEQLQRDKLLGKIKEVK